MTMTQTQDGFEVAKADLELRGPGSFLGEEQHGFGDASALLLTKDPALLEEVNTAYETLRKSAKEDEETYERILKAAKEQYENDLGQIVMN